MEKYVKRLHGVIIAALLLVLILPISAKADELATLKVNKKTGEATFMVAEGYDYVLRLNGPSGKLDNWSSSGTGKEWVWPFGQYYKESGTYTYQIYVFNKDDYEWGTDDFSRAIYTTEKISVNWTKPAKSVETPAKVVIEEEEGGVFRVSCPQVDNAYRYYFIEYINGEKRSSTWSSNPSTVFSKSTLFPSWDGYEDPATEKTVYYTVQVLSANLTKYANSGTIKSEKITINKNDPNKKALTVSSKNVATGVKIKWNKYSGAAKYRVFKKDADGYWTKVATVDGTSYIDTKVKPREAGCYTVVALSSSGKELSLYGEGCSTYFYVDSIPVNVKYSDAGVALSWKGNSFAGKYRIYRRVENGEFKAIATTKSLNYVDSNVVYGKTYTYQIQALTANGGYVNEKGAWSMITYKAPAPKVTVSNGTMGVNIKWTKMAGAAKYRIFVMGPNAVWKKLATIKEGTTYTDTTAKVGNVYSYYVVGMDSAGRFMNDYGDGATIMRERPVFDFTLKSVDAGVKVNWKAADGAGKYRVYRKNSDGNWDVLATIKDGSLFYKDTTAVNRKTYTYTVVAMSEGGTALTEMGSGQKIKYVKPVSEAEVVENEVADMDGNVIVYTISADEITEDYITIVSEDVEDASEDEDVIFEEEEETSEEEVISEDTEETSKDEETIVEDKDEEISEDAEDVLTEESEETISEDNEVKSEEVAAEETENDSEEAGEEDTEETAETVNPEIAEEVQGEDIYGNEYC